MVDPKTSAVTMNSGISKVTDVERWGVDTLAPSTIIVCEPLNTFVNWNPLTPMYNSSIKLCI